MQFRPLSAYFIWEHTFTNLRQVGFQCASDEFSLHNDLGNKKLGLVTSSLAKAFFFQIILRRGFVLRSLSTLELRVYLVLVTRELTLSLSRYSAEDAISASFFILYSRPFFKVSGDSHFKENNKGVLARDTIAPQIVSLISDFRFSVYGARTIPFSVMMAVMCSAGVTSNAGL